MGCLLCGFLCVFSGWPATINVSVAFFSTKIRFGLGLGLVLGFFLLQSLIAIVFQFQLPDLSFWVASDFATDDAGPDVAVFLDHGRSWLALSYLQVGGFLSLHDFWCGGSQIQNIQIIDGTMMIKN